MSNCIYLKPKLNNTLECKYSKKIINIKDCTNCPYKEYKSNNHQMKVRTYKLAKLERKRFSLFTEDMEHCYFCKKDKDHIHEVIFGKNRKNSMKYGLTLPLCEFHHKLMHSDTQLIEEYKKRGQAIFEKAYPDLRFEDIFRSNYL